MSGVQTRTDNTKSPFILYGDSYIRDNETIQQDAGRTTDLAEFTVLGKVKHSTPATVAVVGTGNGTCTGIGFATFGGVIIGTYNLECIIATAEGGTFKLEDPNSKMLANNLVLNTGAGLATTFTVGALTFTITEGGTDFSVADSFSIVVTAVEKYVPLAPLAIDGAGMFAGIMLVEDILSADLVAGDVVGNNVLIGSNCLIDAEQIVYENSLTADSVLPSGLTIREEMALVGILINDTVQINRHEN
jgi:hypothetical protein